MQNAAIQEKWILVDSKGHRVAPVSGTFKSLDAANGAIQTLTESVKQAGVTPKQLLEG